MSSQGPRPKLASAADFLECVRNKSPEAEEAISRIVERFRQIHGIGDGRFVMGLQAATANLYWRPATGALRRIFAMTETGRFRIWLHYVRSVGREDIVTTIRQLSTPVVVIGPSETSGALSVDRNNVEAILSVIDTVVAAVAQMDP